jgi:capsular polysaccharide biosynthesis protein
VVEASARLLRQIPEAHILSSTNVIFSRDRRFITDNAYGDEAAALYHDALSGFARTFSPADGRLGAVFSLLGPFSHNYFHWLNDHLPKVEDFLLWRRTVAPNAKLLLAPAPWQIRLLELLGVGRELWIAFGMSHARAEVAAVASYPGYREAHLPATPERLTWLRSRIFAALELKAQRGTRRIFISRRDSTRRPISNEEQVIRTLEECGFETVVLKNLEIDDQVRLFAMAGVVVAAHGAGLANLLFSTAPIVIELFAPGWVRSEYQALTLFTGGRHVGVSLQGSLQGGLRADVEGLLRVLREVCVAGTNHPI